MHIGVLGINFKSAEIGIREAVSKACQKRLSNLDSLVQTLSCVVLSTCNRTEIYFSADNLAEAHSILLSTLREEIAIPFEHKLYSYFGLDCFLHLAVVTAGLDSAIVGESEIQRQVKTAYEQACHHGLSSCVHYLFQKSLKLGKQIRSTLCLSQNQVSIAAILFKISRDLICQLQDTPLLFIGNSEINRKVIAYFKRKGIEQITLCTRSVESARAMAEKDGLQLLSWDHLSTWTEFPLVICGSNAPHYLVTWPYKELKTQLIFDLSVPRTVDPSLSRHPQFTLLNIEEIGSLIESLQGKNSLEVNRAETLLLESVQRYFVSFRQKEKRVFACAG